MVRKLKKGLTASGAFFTVLWLPLTFPDVHDYIDPGTGSLIVQVVIASVVGGLFVFKVFWGKVKKFFRNLFTRTSRNDD